MPITVDLGELLGQVRAEIGDDDATPRKGKRPDGSNIADGLYQVWLDRAATQTTNAERQVMLTVAMACEHLARLWTNAADLETTTRKEYYSVVATGWATRASEIRASLTGGLRVRKLAVRSNVATTEYST